MHCRWHLHKFLSAPHIRHARSVRTLPRTIFPAGDTDIEADPSYRAGVAVLPPRGIRPKDTPQVLPQANHQSHARRGVTGQPSHSNRLSLRKRRPCGSNHGRTQPRQTADFRHLLFLQQSLIMASAAQAVHSCQRRPCNPRTFQPPLPRTLLETTDEIRRRQPDFVRRVLRLREPLR